MEEKKVPLHRRMRRERHKKIARVQDTVVETLYRVFPSCYSGNRFSEDVDAYIGKKTDKINTFFNELEKAGFEIVKRRMTKSALYSVLSFGGIEVRFEALLKHVEGVVTEYETYEGILFNVFTLPPEGIILEKIGAYLKRRKIRDLYDIFFLLRYVKDTKKLKPELVELLQSFKAPVDEGELKTLILFGAIPTSVDILEFIRRWAR